MVSLGISEPRVSKELQAANWQLKEVSSPLGLGFSTSVPGYLFKALPGGFEFSSLTSYNQRMRWTWVSKGRRTNPEGERGGSTNYYVGNQPASWRTGARAMEKVRYRQVWPGIDVLLYGTGTKFEYDFIVAPGANPNLIRIRPEGARAVSVEEDGLLFRSSAGEFHQSPAVLYQERDGKRLVVKGHYRLAANGDVGIEVGPYDHHRPLIIDPVLTYSMEFGAKGSESVAGLARDSSGNLYVAGTTVSTTQPGAISGNLNIGAHTFIRKLDSAGKVISTTFLSGSGEDHAGGISLDDEGNAYVAGWTTSSDFPVRGALQATLRGVRNGFLVKLNPEGTIVFSTYLGGSGADEIRALTFAAGNAYVAGVTTSKDFPVVGAAQEELRGEGDGFVAKVSGDGTRVIFSTYLGGTSKDSCRAIAVDAAGRSYVAGETESSDLSPTRTFGGKTDAFVARLNAKGDALEYLTLLGGGGNEEALGIAVDAANRAYVTGWTSSSDFPVASALSPTLRGTENAFVARLTAAGSIDYSTYLGGTKADHGLAIQANSEGEAFVTGWTTSIDFPTRSPVQGELSGPQDAFFVKLSATGETILDATFLGGSGVDVGTALLIDRENRAYLAGNTEPTSGGKYDFPVSGDRASEAAGAFLSQLEPCRYEFSWTSRSVDRRGGTEILRVTPNASNCEWNAKTLPDWVRGQASSSRGRGEFSLVIEPNPNLSSRRGSFAIEGSSLTILQNSAQTSGSLTISTDYSGYAIGQVVTISGQFLDSASSPIPSSTIAIQITQGSIIHSINAVTNATGGYSVPYQPSASELGVFLATATGISSGVTKTATISFQLFGASIQVPSGNLPAGNTNWSQTGAVYVIANGGVTVPSGATLTISPGVVVKFRPNVGRTATYIQVEGSLVANGTPTQPIIMTSYNDDTAGGDTNADGIASTPKAGDWGYIQYRGSATGSVSNAVIRYGGSQWDVASQGLLEAGVLDIQSQSTQPNLVNLTITDNITGIRMTNGAGTTLYVATSSFARNTNGVHELDGASVRITGSTFTDNIKGVWGESGSVASVTDGTINTSAGKVQIFLSAAGFQGTYGNNTVTGSGVAFIETQAGTMRGANAWSQVGLPYVIDNGALVVPTGSTLTISPGIVVKFRPNVGRTATYIPVEGSLVANGTPTQPITLTSYKDDAAGGDTNADGSASAPKPGDWGYIQYRGSATGSISNVLIRYGGSQWDVTSQGVLEAGVLDIQSQSTQPNLANLTITDNITGIRMADGAGNTLHVATSSFVRNTNGVHELSGASVKITGSTFTDNIKGVWGESGSDASITDGTISTSAGLRQIFVSAAGFQGTYGNNTVTGSGIAFIETQPGNMQGANAWNQVGIPYVIDNGSLSVPGGASLTIASGVVVKFAPNVGRTATSFRVDGGSFTANGTSQQPIIFTSYKDDTVLGDTNGDGNASLPAPGDWGSMLYNTGSRGSVSNAVIRYGGSNWDVATQGVSEVGALYIENQSSQPVLGNLTITDNIVGILFNNGLGNKPTVTASSFARNATGVHILSPFVTITGSTFTDNTIGVRGEAGSGAAVTGGTISTSAGKRQIFLSTAGFQGTYGGNTVSGPGIALIETQPGNMQGANAWNQVGIPYVIDNGSLSVPGGASLTIASGVVVKFAPNVGRTATSFRVDGGSFTANGTSQQPIIFTSYKDDTVLGDTNGDGNASLPAPGDWGSMLYNTGSKGSVSNAVIRYGGSNWDVATQGVSEVGALYIENQSSQPVLGNLTITDNIVGILFNNGLGNKPTVMASSFARNATGVHILSPFVTITGSTFMDNTIGVRGESGSGANIKDGTINTSAGKRQIFSSAAGFQGTYGNNTVTGSGLAFIETQAGTMQGVNAWNQVGIPYVIDNGGLVLPAGSTLTISPGVVAKFGPNVGRTATYIQVNGSLVANGTATQPITLTSYKDDTIGGDTNADGNASAPAPGDWGYILYYPGSTGSVSNALIRYGGSQWDVASQGVAEIGALDIQTLSIQPTLANLTVTDNITGIRVAQGAGTNPTVTACTFARNTTGVHVLLSAAPTITGSNFTGNGTGVQNDTPATLVNAVRNYWGSISGPSGAGPGTGDRVSTGVTFAPFLTSPVATAASFVYVANYHSNNVSAYSISTTGGVLIPIPGSPFQAGSGPYSVTVDSSSHFVYVANRTSNDVSAYAINATTGVLNPVPGSPFSTPTGPLSLTVSPSGPFAYVVNSTTISAYRIDNVSGVLSPIPGSPFSTEPFAGSITVTPSGRFAYVTSHQFGEVSAYSIDPVSGALAAVPGSPFGTGTFAGTVTVTPSGKFAYVADSGSGVYAYSINLSSGALTPVPGSPFPAGMNADSVTVDPSSQFAYVANQSDNNVSVYSINAATGALTPIPGSPFNAGLYPSSVSVDHSGQFVYVTNSGSNDVSVYGLDATTGALAPRPGSPFGAGAAPASLVAAPINPNPQSTFFAVLAPSTVTVAVPFSYTVTAKDQFNNLATGYSGIVHFTSSDGAAVLSANATLTNGIGTFSATLKTVGTQTITATDATTSSMTGSSNLIVVSPAAATHFVVVAPTTTVAGVPFNLTVTAQDQFNNRATGYAGTVHFTSTDGIAALPANLTLSNGAGTFTATLKTLGLQTITATDTTSIAISGTSNGISVSPATATHFVVAAPAGAIAGAPLSFTVTAKDQLENVATNYSGTVRFTSSDGVAVLPANSNLLNGVGNFSATLKTAATQTITATDTIASAITGVSGVILVAPASATNLAILVPATTATGSSLNFKVTAQDAFNNTATGYVGTVHFTSSDQAAALPVNSALPNGVGMFAATLNTVGNETITATDSALPSITGTSGTIAVGAAVCIAPPPGLVSWWSADGVVSDLQGRNNPSTSNAVSFVPAKVGTGFMFGSGGYLDIPASASLANQKFTLTAWVRPEGPGPNNDEYGSWIVGQNFDNTHGLGLLWRSTDSHFSFGFGSIFSESIASQQSFPHGSFYLVSATYDGTTFSLYVNGSLEGQLTETTTVPYTNNTWSIGSTPANIRNQGYPRTWNGVIDEVQIFNRALSAAEIQAIFAIGSVGECKGSGQQPNLTISKSHVGSFTQGQAGAKYTITIANSGTGQTSGAVTVAEQLPTGLTAPILTGPGWNCGMSSCTRSDALPPAASYPPITLTVSVDTKAPSSLTNSATVSGGGDPNSHSASDVTTITQIATHFAVSTPMMATKGSAIFFSVTALDAANNPATNYGGTVHFTSSDGAAGLPGNLALSGGIGTFSATLNTLGVQTITATDTASLSITGTSNGISVIPPPPPPGTITVATDQPLYHRATPVQISGKLSTATGAGIPSASVNLNISVKGATRVITAFTDASGVYKVVFQPTASDGGSFTVTATAVSGGVTLTASANFRVLGMLLSPNLVNQDLAMGFNASVTFNVQNVADAALTNLTYAFSVTPTGALTASQPQAFGSLPAGASFGIPVILTAPSGNPPAMPVKVIVSFAGTDILTGISETGSATIFVTLHAATITPLLLPATATIGVNPGQSITRTFVVRNDGYAPMTNSQVSLQSANPIPWVGLGNSNLGTIAPGGSTQFQVLLSPPSALAIGSYPATLIITGGPAPLQGTLAISVTANIMGSTDFVISDDVGAKVSGATVTLVGKTNGKSYQGVADSTGHVTINGVDGGDYSYLVTADTHDPGSGSVTVTPSATASVSVILSYNVVTLTFIVVPTTIVDQYNVTLNVTYATTLPKPALQVVPYSLGFSFFPEDVPNGRFSCSLSITNSHPTASVRDLLVDASQLDLGTPVGQRMLVFFPDGTQTYKVGSLTGKGSVAVPCYAKLDSGTVATHAVGNIVVQGNYDYSLDGQTLQGTTSTNVPVNYVRPSDIQFAAIPFTYDMMTDPNNPVLKYTGGSLVLPVKSNRQVSMSLLQLSGAPFNGRNLVAFTNTLGGATIPDIITKNQANSLWRTDFAKQILSGSGDTTTYDISAPDGGLTLTQILSAAITANPDQVLNNPSFVAFEGQWADGASVSPFLIPIQITKVTPTSVSTSGGGGGGVAGCLDPNIPECKDPVPVVLPGGPAREGTILIALDQTIRLERQAFNATLGIGARTALANAKASIQIRDNAGNDVTLTKFFVLVSSDPMGATHGGVISGSTSVAWQLVPMVNAGGTVAAGTQYKVQAHFSYAVNGVIKSADTQVVTITVLPSPLLTVAYSAPYVVMPGKEAKVRVTLKNVGFGVARNLSIQTMQPRIVESVSAEPIDVLLGNPGPVVEFNITGSSNTPNKIGYTPGALTVRFGDVAPGATVSGYWTLQASRKGFFIDISSTFTHQDYNGVTLDPLIQTPTTTLVPAIGGTVTTTTTGEDSQYLSGVAVAVSQGGVLKGSDVTDQVGNYYISDLSGGNYLEEIRDVTNQLLTSKSIGVVPDQGTNFIDFAISQPTSANITITSSPAGQPFAVDGQCYTSPQTFKWDFGSHHAVAFPTATAVPGSPALRNVFAGWADGISASIRDIAAGSSGGSYTANFTQQPVVPTILTPGSAGMRITSPPDGKVVNPGDTLSVVIEPDAGVVIQKVAAWIPPVSTIPQVLQTPPFQTTVSVPSGVLGPATLQAYALDSTNNTLRRALSVFIESPIIPTSLTASPGQVAMSVAGLTTPAQITAAYADNSSGVITGSSFMALSSTNDKVATVDANGNIVAVAPGTCSVCAAYRGKVATLPVSVGVFSTPGDLDGDGDVDQDDLNLLTKALNTPATGLGDPRDLNKDGIINALDARILATACTRPRCATK